MSHGESDRLPPPLASLLSTVTNRGVLELTVDNSLGCILRPLKVTEVTEIGIKTPSFLSSRIHISLLVCLPNQARWNWLSALE